MRQHQKYRITKISKEDAYYSDRKTIVGLVGKITNVSYPTYAGYVSCDFTSGDRVFCFLAVQLEDLYFAPDAKG